MISMTFTGLAVDAFAAGAPKAFGAEPALAVGGDVVKEDEAIPHENGGTAEQPSERDRLRLRAGLSEHDEADARAVAVESVSQDRVRVARAEPIGSGDFGFQACSTQRGAFEFGEDGRRVLGGDIDECVTFADVDPMHHFRRQPGFALDAADDRVAGDSVRFAGAQPEPGALGILSSRGLRCPLSGQERLFGWRVRL